MSSNNALHRIARHAALALSLVFACGAAHAGATIRIINANGAGEGFNDPTPAAPVGGNTGATLGEQRLLAFTHAANKWAATLDSPVEIRILTAFVPMACSANSAVLAAAGTTYIFAEFTNSPRPESWYPAPLANKIAGGDLLGPDESHIVAVFNSRVGQAADCMPGSAFYLGLDGVHGGQIDLVTVMLHEMAHGLGFQTFTDGATGAQVQDRPSVWDHYLLDTRTGKNWAAMSAAERAASATGGDVLAWSGANVSAAVPSVLAPRANMAVSGPAAGDAAGNYKVGDASFGPPLSLPGVSGQLMPVVDQPDGTGIACSVIAGDIATAIRGNIALVDRGGCPFTTKAANVQAAGATGMVVADNAPGEVASMGGSAPGILIPSVRITQADGARLKAQLARRSRTKSGVIANLGVDPNRLAGADSAGRMLMYAPNPYQGGSSVSHYSTDGRPNVLMEPAINPDLTHSLSAPTDLTLELLKDIGW